MEKKQCCDLDVKCVHPPKCVLVFGPRLTAYLERLQKPLEDGALLEEAGHWGWDLRFSSPPPLPVHSLLPDCTWHVASCLKFLAPQLLYHNGLLYLLELRWKTVWWFLRKLRSKIPYDPTVQLLGVYAEKKKSDSEEAI